MQKLQITPRGWLRQYLETQMAGLTGHITVAGYPFHQPFWGDPEQMLQKDAGWWPYEQTGYWLDGYLRCAILLGDAAALEEASGMIYRTLDLADTDGYLGPRSLRDPQQFNRWPHVVFFRSCIALYEANGDPRIVEALSRHYLGCPTDLSNGRNVLHVEILVWLYQETGNRAFLQQAVAAYDRFNFRCQWDSAGPVALSRKKPYAHGVSYNEISKLGVILYGVTGKKLYLRYSTRAYDKLERDFMLPGGCHSSSEFLTSNDYYESYETCNISDMTWSLGYFYAITGNPHYGDLLENCVFNAGQGSVLEDFTALQYLSCANQVILTATSNHNDFYKGCQWMSFRPCPATECCTGNVNRFMPNYIWRMFRVSEGAVTAALYGPARLETQVNGFPVTITETTDYPFRESIRLEVETRGSFRLKLRVPGWATGISGSCGGAPLPPPEEGHLCLDITGDTVVELAFACQVETHRVKQGVWFSRGPLVYALGSRGNRKTVDAPGRSTPEFPAYDTTADLEWRYAVSPDVLPEYTPGTATRWDADLQVPTLTVPARRLENWDYAREQQVRCVRNNLDGTVEILEGDYTFTPRLPGGKQKLGEETRLQLIPYGAAKIRLTVFPALQDAQK